MQHIPSSLPPPINGLISVPIHSDGHSWKSWLSNQVNHCGRLEANQELLHIVAPDISMGLRLLWDYLLYASDITPTTNAEMPTGASITKFPLWALFTNHMGGWSM